jgi:N-acetylneuraminate synthase/N,N'-diacetyllegionaminate synthase
MENPFLGKYGPLLIAEIGGNHEGNFEYARKLTKLAIDSGADFVKFQIYTGDTLVSSIESPDRNAHFKKFELTPKQHVELAKMVTDAGVQYMASVWDLSALDWIDEFLPIYKIGSGDLTAYPILREFAKREKPIILSTGLATTQEIMEAVSVIQSENPVYKDKRKLALLQCTSMYPINPEDANLNVMYELRQKTGLTIGYSDHTEGCKALYYAVAMGAEILEFHFTDTREGKQFRDHKVSLTSEEVKQLIAEIELIRKYQGVYKKQPTAVELANKHEVSFRRAVYPARDIAAGELLTTNNLTVLRPNHGIDAREFDNVLGKKSKVSLKKHQKLDWDMFE